MNSQNADYTKRLSISDHDLIIQEVDDGDEEWTSCKESYQALVVGLFLPYGRFIFNHVLILYLVW